MAGMPQARVGDLSKGHWIGIFYFPPTPLNKGAGSAFSSGPAMSRVGDTADTHFAFIYGIVPFPLVKHSGRKAATGAPTTLEEGPAAFRVGDYYDCGDCQAIGNPSHLIGG